MPHPSALPLVLCDGEFCDAVQWVQQAHPAETEDVTAVWSVGSQVAGPGMVQVKCSCSSRSRSPCGPVELHLSAYRNIRTFNAALGAQM